MVAPLHVQVAAPWDQPFDVSNIKSMELVVLATLQWRVVSVTATNFVDRLLRGIFDAAELHGTELLLELRTKSMALVAKTLPGELAHNSALLSSNYRRFHTETAVLWLGLMAHLTS
jgi:hypothetical protein